MLKLVIVGTIMSVISAFHHHPVNEDLVREIKQKATTWEPFEVEENPLRHFDAKHFYTGLVGTLEETQLDLINIAEYQKSANF
jgi:hypothetical protein